MRGWKFFTHSAGLVFRNFDAALRISLLPFGAHILSQAWLAWHPELVAMPAELGGELPQVEPLTYTIFFVLQIASLVSSLWIAVAWHRYVLTEEMGQGWVPVFRGDLVLGYLGRSVLLGLLMLLALVTAAIPAGILMQSMPAATIPLLLACLYAALYLFFRLGVILPAGAVGQRITLQAAWQATGREQGAILGLALVVVGVMSVMFILSIVMQSMSPPVAGIFGLIFGWVATMVGASLLTSLFGICVEQRSID